jgi:uncharacterized protein with HEPN domain
MKRNYLDFVHDIADAINDILKFVEDMQFEDFANDKKTQYAVIRCFEVIGEATKTLPPDYRQKYPDLPWSKMAKMRDLLIHHYMGVDLSIVWQTIRIDLPAIKTLIDIVMKEVER